MVCWFAGIFYLPRLFVYHAACEDQPGRERFKIMERKLYNGITTPSMIATVIFGVWLLSYNVAGYFSQGWMHAKLALVALLIVYHFYCGHLVKVFRDDRNTRGHVFSRICLAGGRYSCGCTALLGRHSTPVPNNNLSTRREPSNSVAVLKY
jgi:putative membrane protein